MCYKKSYFMILYIVPLPFVASSYISTSSNSRGVLNGVGFEPPKPHIPIFLMVTLLPWMLMALELSILLYRFTGSQFPGIARTGMLKELISFRISSASSGGPKSVISPVSTIRSTGFSLRYSDDLRVFTVNIAYCKDFHR